MKKVKVKKVKFGELENNVMESVWELSNDDKSSLVDVRSIIQSLKTKNPNREYVYTTIHTTCLRLCRKKRLDKVQIKNKYYYKAVETRDMALLKDLQILADKYFQGNIEETLSALRKLIC
ncbi:MAG: BlaI/MecI/CopY family transcriptional regulator [Cyanobacteriota bacterium]